MLPITPDGVNAFDRWVNLQWIGITRDVDYIAGKIGISDLPKPIPFVAIVGTFTLTLIIFYWQLFACLREDEADLQAQREKKYRWSKPFSKTKSNPITVAYRVICPLKLP